MIRPNKAPLKGANRMIITKARASFIVLAATASFAGASLAPAASQALINNNGYQHSAEGFNAKINGGGFCGPAMTVGVSGDVSTPVGPNNIVSASGGSSSAVSTQPQECQPDSGYTTNH
ncbi:MAG: hypothetical protein JOZ49_04880 [Mycolicibacterium sp.]|nr:hypothetical protein [Mycolicibacterium sp.]